MKKLSCAIISMILILGAFFIFGESTDDVDAVGEPEIRIELAQTKQTAYVAPGQDGVVTFTGTVTVQIPWSPNIQYLVVTLEASCLDWPVSVPPSLTFNKAQKQQSFTLSVQVPVGTPVTTSAILFVNGTWQYSPGVTGGECDGATAVIVIKQFYSFTASPKEAVTYVEEDSIGEMAFMVENLGNGDDRIRMEILNSAELQEYGILVIPSKETVKLPYDEIVEAFLIITVDDNAIFDTFQVEVRFTSDMAETLGDIGDVENAYGYLEVVAEGELPEPEEPDKPEEPEEPEEPEQPEDPEEPEEPDESDEPEEDNDQLVEDDDDTEEDGRPSGITTGSEDRGGIGITGILILVGIIILLVVIAGAYIIIRKGKKTGT